MRASSEKYFYVELKNILKPIFLQKKFNLYLYNSLLIPFARVCFEVKADHQVFQVIHVIGGAEGVEGLFSWNIFKKHSFCLMLEKIRQIVNKSWTVNEKTGKKRK